MAHFVGLWKIFLTILHRQFEFVLIFAVWGACHGMYRTFWFANALLETQKNSTTAVTTERPIPIINTRKAPATLSTCSKLWLSITSHIDKNKQICSKKSFLGLCIFRVISCLMSRLEGAGTLWRISQSLAVLGSSLLPPPVLQLVHHLPLVFCIYIGLTFFEQCSIKLQDWYFWASLARSRSLYQQGLPLTRSNKLALVMVNDNYFCKVQPMPL